MKIHENIKNTKNIKKWLGQSVKVLVIDIVSAIAKAIVKNAPKYAL